MTGWQAALLVAIAAGVSFLAVMAIVAHRLLRETEKRRREIVEQMERRRVQQEEALRRTPLSDRERP